MNQIRPRNHHLRGLRLPSMPVKHHTLVARAARRSLHQPQHVHHIIMRFFQLALSKVRQQMLIPPMPIYNQNFLAPIARHLIRGLLQKLQLQLRTVSDGPRLMLSFEYLPKVILRKNQSILLSSRLQSRITYIQKIGPQGQMRTMLLQNSKRQNTSPLRLANSRPEIGRRQLFPANGKSGLRPAEDGPKENSCEKNLAQHE